MQELIEGALFAAVEGAAFDETVLPIERESGLEIVAPTPVRKCASAVHGVDFAGSWLELLQCTEAKKVFALLQCIEADLWLLQSQPIGVHTFEMPGQQRLHLIVAKVAGLDDGHRSRSTSSMLSNRLVGI
jgi:hypothetical protein